MNKSEKPLRINIVSDVVYPWCVVGYRQLAAALKQTNTAHEIHWHPFELNTKEIRAAEQYCQQQGIQSVPSIIFNERHLISGAQGVNNYESILQQLAEMPD